MVTSATAVSSSLARMTLGNRVTERLGGYWLDGQPVASAQLFAWRMAPEPTWMARLHGDAVDWIPANND